MEDTIIPFFKNKNALTFGMGLTGLIVSLVVVFRFIPSLPEPELPIKTPFGRLLFFDGIILYGVVILILLGLLDLLLP